MSSRLEDSPSLTREDEDLFLNLSEALRGCRIAVGEDFDKSFGFLSFVPAGITVRSDFGGSVGEEEDEEGVEWNNLFDPELLLVEDI